MQQPQPLDPKVTLTAQGQQAPQVALTSSPAPNASLTKLRELEQALLAQIEALQIDQQKKDAFKKRLQEDINLAKNATFASLDDNQPQPLKASEQDSSKGLKDRQNKTSTEFDTNIKDANAKKALDDVHNMRLTLLQNKLEAQKKLDNQRALELFDKYTNRIPVDDLNVSARKAGTAESKDFLEQLGSNPVVNSEVKDSEGKVTKKINFEYIPATGGATSNDPIALGYGMVAAGNKSIVFGGHPRKALEAAKAAFEAGAESFDLEGVTKRHLEDPRSGLFSSFDDWRQLNAEFERLQQLYAARRKAKETTPNDVFNENVAKNMKTVEEFTKVTDFKEQSLYLSGLTATEQVDLAIELERRFNNEDNPRPYYAGTTKERVDVYEYFRHLLAFDERKDYVFVSELGKRQGSAEKIAEFKQINDPLAAAQFIHKIKDPTTRNKFYEQIDHMDNSNQAFRNNVRAACLGASLDSYYKASRANPQCTKLTDVRTGQQKEVMEILRGTPPDQLNSIISAYELNFRRDTTKKTAYVKNHPDFKYSDKPLPADFFNTHEGANQEKTLLKSHDDINRYMKFSTNVSEVLRGYQAKPTAIPPAKNPPVDFVRFAPRAPGARS